MECVVNRLFMKRFDTSNMNNAKECQTYFGFVMPGVVSWKRRVDELEKKCDLPTTYFFRMAQHEIKLK